MNSSVFEQACFEQACEAAEYLRVRTVGAVPLIGIVLGSGLGGVADAVQDAVCIAYTDIPYFPQPTVAGHSGKMVLGRLNGIPVIVMQGRVHFYEGYTPQQVTFPVRVLGQLGIETLILTNAAGGIRPGLQVGQLILLADHINLLGFHPLVGPNEPRFGKKAGTGLRFFDMSNAYDSKLRELAQRVATEQNLHLDEGIYLAVSGPSFETPAEIRAFQRLGADLVGMSTVPETIVARHMGMQVLGVSCVTNLAAGLTTTPLSHEEVFESGRRAEQQLTELFTRLLPEIAAILPEKAAPSV
jgi:purine-nucleoside phosphorylase